jgi:hypothetical protein
MERTPGIADGSNNGACGCWNRDERPLRNCSTMTIGTDWLDGDTPDFQNKRDAVRRYRLHYAVTV